MIQDRAPSKAPLRGRCILWRSVRYIVMHSKPYRSLSLSLKIEPFSQSEGPKYLLPPPPSPPFLFSSMGQCSNDYSNEAYNRKALTFVFYSAYIRVWWPLVAQIGLTFAHLFLTILVRKHGKRAKTRSSLFSLTIVRNAPKSARPLRQCLEMHASWHKADLSSWRDSTKWINKELPRNKCYKQFFSIFKQWLINIIIYLWSIW